MSTKPTDRYFYHSFPRRVGEDEIKKGLQILESMVESGLLLTPEQTSWSEPLTDGTHSEPWKIIQKRACFTELSPSELQDHAAVFGHFAIEFEVQTMREIGGIPVFYLPRPSKDDVGLESTAASLLCRMGEIQRLLNRLGDLEKLVGQEPNKRRLLAVQDNRSGESQDTRITFGGAEDLLAFLNNESQPVAILGNALRAFSGFFYPTEDLRYMDLLGYYRQREWRIVANMSKLGEELTRDLFDNEKAALLELDEQFFGRETEYFTGTYRLCDQSQYFPELEGRSFVTYARRVIVPDEAVDEAAKILAGEGLPDVVGVSDI